MTDSNDIEASTVAIGDGPLPGTATVNIRGTFNSEELQNLLREIGAKRAEIANDGVKPFGHEVSVSYLAPWSTYMRRGGSHSVIMFQSPAYGWVGFSLTNEDLSKLITVLQQQLKQSMELERGTRSASAAAWPTKDDQR